MLEDILPELLKARVFTTVDLKFGYWHCVLVPEWSVLITFATPYGRYRWRCLPFRLSTSSEIFQKHLNQVLENLPGVLCIVDNILIYGSGDANEEVTTDHDRNLQNLLQRCLDRSIVLSPEKMKLQRKEVPFMGHFLMSTGLKPDRPRWRPSPICPNSKTSRVSSVYQLSIINYLAKFLTKLSEVMEPIRRLTRYDTPWEWSREQNKEFQTVQKLVTEVPILSYYDPSKELTIQCNTSQSGLGAAPLQNGRPIEYASHALTETEICYAQIEKEMLAIVSSLEHFNQYAFGCQVNDESDPKPLETILQKPLVWAPRQLKSMMMRLQKVRLHCTLRTGHKDASRGYVVTSQLPFPGKEDDVEYGPVLTNIWETPQQNQNGYLDRLVTRKPVWNHPCRMARWQEERPATESPLLQHMGQAHCPRRTDL